MSRTRLALFGLLAILLATTAAAIVAGAAASDDGSGGPGTEAARFVVDRNTTVDVRAANTPNGRRYAERNAEDELRLDFERLNADGRTRADRVLAVEATSDRRLQAAISSNVDGVSFYWGSNPEDPASEAGVLEPDGTRYVGVVVETDATAPDGTFTIRVGEYFSGGVGRSGELSLPNRSLRWSVPNAGQPVELSIPVRNDGDAPIARSVALQIDGATVARRDVALQPRSTTNVTFEHVFDEAGTYDVGVDGQVVGTVTVQGGSFEVSNATLDRSVVVTGESATVSAAVTNHAAEGGPYTAALEVGGAVVDRSTVYVPAGETVEVEFERTFDRRGGYDVAISGESAGRLHVESPGGAAIRRYGGEYGGLLGVLSIPAAGAAIALARGRGL